jgi:hypothetical protein
MLSSEPHRCLNHIYNSQNICNFTTNKTTPAKREINDDENNDNTTYQKVPVRCKWQPLGRS